MEEHPKENTGIPPQLLNLIPDEREWRKVRDAGDHGGRSSRAGAIFDAEKGEELELKLGLPGVQLDEDGESCSALSLGRLPAHPRLAKRGFFDTVEAKPQGYGQRQRDREGCGSELTLGGGGESMLSGERKKGCCPPPSTHGSAAAPAAPLHSSSSPQGRAAVLPVVGWPPVRSFRRNLTNGTSSKQSPERQNDEAPDKAKLICKKRPLVKINMDGIPIGRKVNLTAYDSYQKLSSAVEELFRGFLEAQNDLSCAESGEQRAEEKIFSGLLDGTGEYALVYEDDDGDRLLVGDIPWSAFVSAAKRLRVMRRSELPQDLVSVVPLQAL
uniref:Uncharacterized protein n=1 Tax=Avena sativa TaxID=4498 RepID=A0ACD5U1B2_AVESA